MGAQSLPSLSSASLHCTVTLSSLFRCYLNLYRILKHHRMQKSSLLAGFVETQSAASGYKQFSYKLDMFAFSKCISEPLC